MNDLTDLKRQVQQALVEQGYNLGTSGPLKNGVDGDPGRLTWQAIAAVLLKEAVAPVPVATGAIAMISAPLLALAASPRPLAELEPWVAPMRAACAKVEINTIRRVAAFIAQIGHESDFKPRSENLNYSVEGLLKTFGRHRISAADCNRFGRKTGQPANQQAIANCIYGGAWGAENLGNTQPGDGWLFRGVGPLQVTGRSNMTRFAKFLGRSLEETLAYARTLEGGIMAAAWFWEENDINRLADTPGVADETKRINGGQNGLAHRKQLFDRLVDRMLEIEKGQ
jgi:putative chitinase